MRRLLIIDDDELLRNSLGMMLGARGFLCTPAPNALDGIEQAEAGQFDVALVDINMPGLDGFEVIKALARIKPRMSVVALSASANLPRQRSRLTTSLSTWARSK